MARVTNVTLRFRLTQSETVPAGRQHVYIDVSPGTMTHVQTNPQGRISVALDDARDYHVVTSARAMAPAPGAQQGATVRVRNRTITVDPHIRIRVTAAGGAGAAGLRCVLAVGSQTTNVTTSRSGWVWSNDRTSGAVTLRADTKLITGTGAADPQPRLTVTPSPLPRGSNATITLQPPQGATGLVGLKAIRWEYHVSHTNPGDAAASTATIVRPASESQSTFGQSWQGTVCASGTAKAKFVAGTTLRASADAAVSATVVAKDPLWVEQSVTVAARTGQSWQTQLTENQVGALNNAVTRFSDLGQHAWDVSASIGVSGRPIPTGPNRGCKYVTQATVTAASTPRINPRLTDSSTPFYQAQDKAYLTDPAPVRVIPRQFYSIGAQGAITITNVSGFQQHFNISAGQSYDYTHHFISMQTLENGVRRHEYQDADKSHKTNCLRALRALEPARYAEALVQLPRVSLNLMNRALGRANLLKSASVARTHEVIDEARTRQDHAVRYVAGQSIAACNADANGALIAYVWNPTNSRYLS